MRCLVGIANAVISPTRGDFFTKTEVTRSFFYISNVDDLQSDKLQKNAWRSIYYDRKSDKIIINFVNGTAFAIPARHRMYFESDKPLDRELRPQRTNKTNIYNRTMYALDGDLQLEQRVRRICTAQNIPVSEIDIDYRTRWLSDYYAGNDVTIAYKDVHTCFIDIEIAGEGKPPSAKKAEFPINVVTLIYGHSKKGYVFGLGHDISDESKKYLAENNATYSKHATEAELLEAVFKTIALEQTDVLTGWNSDFFDFPYIANRAAKLKVPLKIMSQLPVEYKRGEYNRNELRVSGMEAIDFMLLYKKFTLKERDSFKLDAIGEAEIGEHKAPLENGYLTYKTNWDQWVLYNYQDVKLMVKIEDKKQMFATTYMACGEAKVPFGSIFSAKKMLVGFIINFLHARGKVFPPAVKADREGFPGAFVYAVPGRKENIISYDYRSMYPSLIMGANVSPETLVKYPIDYVVPEEIQKTLVKSPWTSNGKYQYFYRMDRKGIIPEITDMLFGGRTRLKKQMKQAYKEGNKELGDVLNMKQGSYKIFGNALYGLLGNPYFQFYMIANSAAITAYGVDLIKSTTKSLCEFYDTELENDTATFEENFGYIPSINPEYKGVGKGHYVEGNVVFKDDGTHDDDIDWDSLEQKEEQEELAELSDRDPRKIHNRLSHGDTDSFFIKIGDIAGPFLEKKGKEVGVWAYEGDKLLYRKSWGVDEAGKAKSAFNSLATQYCGADWTALPNDKKMKTLCEGILYSGNYRIIYSRYDLTDFSRIYDTCIMETKLAEYMKAYADKWNFYDPSTLFLKREKCISKLIVTAMKKYICRVESNEDAREIDVLAKKESDKKTAKNYDAVLYEYGDYFTHAKYAITGLEIVRSSTSAFTRKHVEKIVHYMLNNDDRDGTRAMFIKVKEAFFESVAKGEYFEIAIPSGISKDPPRMNLPKNELAKLRIKLDEEDDEEKKEAIRLSAYALMTEEDKKKIDWRLRAASVWNYLIDEDPELSKMPLEPIYESSKVKFIKVYPNSYNLSCIAVTDPIAIPRMLEIVAEANWHEQWNGTFAQTLNRFAKAVWGIDNLEASASSGAWKMF